MRRENMDMRKRNSELYRQRAEREAGANPNLRSEPRHGRALAPSESPAKQANKSCRFRCDIIASPPKNQLWLPLAACELGDLQTVALDDSTMH
jgi:hypothetical protein